MTRFLPRLLLLTTALLAARVGGAVAQEPPLALQIAGVSDAGYPKAQAVITMEDASNAAAPALTAGDVQVTLDGKPAKVLSADLASSETSPLDVLFVFDTSGSMAGEPIAQAKRAAKAFIAQLAPQDRVGVMAFSDQVQVLQEYTTDHAAASAVIDGLSAAGNTALYQATGGAAVKAGSSLASRRAIVLLSDGADYGSSGSITRQQAIGAVATVGAPIFAVGEGSDIDRAYLQQIADRSNGRYLEAPDPAELGSLYAGIARLLRSQYVITFDASAVTTARSVPVGVTVTSGTRSASAQTTYQATAAVAPTLSLEGIGAGESLTAKRTITAQIKGPQTVTRVTFRVDGREVAQSSFPPYSYVYDPRAFGGGPHTLSVTAESPAGPADASVRFASTPQAAGGGGTSMLLVVGAVAAVLVVLAAAGAFIWRARRNGSPPPATVQIAAMRTRTPPLPTEEPLPVAPAEVIEEPKGILISQAGSDLGSEYIVGGRPVSIGSGEHCAVRVPDRGLSAVEARIWVRGGQLMLHRITSLNALANEGVTGGWSILDPGDSFELGPHAFEFRLIREQATEDAGADVSNILRDPQRPASPRPTPGMRAPEPSRLRLVELMPKNDIELPPDDEERAG